MLQKKLTEGIMMGCVKGEPRREDNKSIIG